jgi:sulfide:quinone oxidoreductase
MVVDANIQGQAPAPAAPDVADPAYSLPRRPRILVLGGGVAGVTAAYQLHRQIGDRASITLIASTERFTLGPALLGVPFGRSVGRVGFALAPALARHGIAFRQGRVQRIEPEHRAVWVDGEELAYDYLLIATGPQADDGSVPGIKQGIPGANALHSLGAARETGQALQRFLDHPGPAVVGLAQGAGYLSPAYEFALLLDYALRRRGIRDRATITFVTPESHLGILGIGIPDAQRLLERLFARHMITVFTGATIERVEGGRIYLQAGTSLAADFCMVMPAFNGAADLDQTPGLSDAYGLIPVDAQYRHPSFPEVYAAGGAAHLNVPAPHVGGLPKTGYLATAMAKAAAWNLAATVRGAPPKARPLPRLLDLRILDGGDCGALLVCADCIIPIRLALPLPGHVAHAVKRVLVRYLLWKLRTDRTYLP